MGPSCVLTLPLQRLRMGQAQGWWWPEFGCGVDLRKSFQKKRAHRLKSGGKDSMTCSQPGEQISWWEPRYKTGWTVLRTQQSTVVGWGCDEGRWQVYADLTSWLWVVPSTQEQMRLIFDKWKKEGIWTLCNMEPLKSLSRGDRIRTVVKKETDKGAWNLFESLAVGGRKSNMLTYMLLIYIYRDSLFPEHTNVDICNYTEWMKKEIWNLHSIFYVIWKH